MKVVWTEHAIAQLVGIYNHIATDSPAYALRMVDRLTARSIQIATFPASGSVVQEYMDSDIRELVERPYRIIYRTADDCVQVLAIVHSAQQLPDSIGM